MNALVTSASIIHQINTLRDKRVVFVFSERRHHYLDCLNVVFGFRLKLTKETELKRDQQQ